MSHEFRTEELFECERCGTLLPGDLMVWPDNGGVYCEDCYDELCSEDDEEYESGEDDENVQVQETPQMMQVPIGQYIDMMDNRLSFIVQLPAELKAQFGAEYAAGRDPFANVQLMARTSGLKLRSFNAIDFETANNHPESICSIGIVFVRDGKIVNRYYSLVHPEPDYYSPFCQRVHGLGPADTDDAPNFKKAWNRIRNEVKRDMVPLVAHNAGFDANCLRTAFRVYQMEDPGYRFLDTLSASRRYFGKTLPFCRRY